MFLPLRLDAQSGVETESLLFTLMMILAVDFFLNAVSVQVRHRYGPSCWTSDDESPRFLLLILWFFINGFLLEQQTAPSSLPSFIFFRRPFALHMRAVQVIGALIFCYAPDGVLTSELSGQFRQRIADMSDDVHGGALVQVSGRVLTIGPIDSWCRARRRPEIVGQLADGGRPNARPFCTWNPLSPRTVTRGYDDIYQTPRQYLSTVWWDAYVFKLCVKKERKSVNNFTLLFLKEDSSAKCKRIQISLFSAARKRRKRNGIVHQMQMLNAYCSCFGQRSSPSKNQCQSVKDEISPYIIFTSYLYWLLLSLKQRSRSLAFFPVIWRWNGRFVWTRSYESDQNLR